MFKGYVSFKECKISLQNISLSIQPAPWRTPKNTQTLLSVVIYHVAQQKFDVFCKGHIRLILLDSTMPGDSAIVTFLGSMSSRNLFNQSCWVTFNNRGSRWGHGLNHLVLYLHTLPETNSLHLKRCHPKRKFIFQPSIFWSIKMILEPFSLWIQSHLLRRYIFSPQIVPEFTCIPGRSGSERIHRSCL